MDATIIACSNSYLLASRLASETGAGLVLVERKLFPDGELYLRLRGDVRGKPVIVQSMHPRPSEALLEFLMVSHSLRSRGVEERAIAVIPYLAYMRQDDEFNPGEVVSARAVAGLLDSEGFDAIITIDMHLHRFHHPSELFSTPVENASAAPLLAQHVASAEGLENPVIVGPDEESEQWARRAAEALGAEYTVFEKHRISADEVEVRPRDSSILRGRDVIIIDDIASTGGTLARTAEEVLRRGARSVYAAVTHGLLVQGAVARIRSSGVERIYATDTVETQYSSVSVAGIIADIIKRIL